MQAMKAHIGRVVQKIALKHELNVRIYITLHMHKV